MTNDQNAAHHIEKLYEYILELKKEDKDNFEMLRKVVDAQATLAKSVRELQEVVKGILKAN